MATTPTNNWDETKPAGTRDINLGDDDIREFKTQVREIIAVDHEIASAGQGANWGKHNILTLLNQAALTTIAGAGRLGCKTVSGIIELFYRDDAGTETQLTSNGKIIGDLFLLSNNVFLKSNDAAGTGTVDLIKANASDKPEIPDGAILTSSAAPTVDEGIANKKYVDDQIAAVPAQVGFGAWASKTTDTVYQAATDGFVLAEGYNIVGNPAVQVLSDAANPPTTIRISTTINQYSAVQGITCPVRKNDFWKAVNANQRLFWISLGS